MSSPAAASGSAASVHESQTDLSVPAETAAQDVAESAEQQEVSGSHTSGDEEDYEEGELDDSVDHEADKSQKESSPEPSDSGNAPPLPSGPTPSGPPLPSEPAPATEDDGWDCQWDANTQAWFFYNRITGKTQWENPRLPNATTAVVAVAPAADGAHPPTDETLAAGGYNPAIHGDYDPDAWYAKGNREADDDTFIGMGDHSALYGSTAAFDRLGQFQSGDVDVNRHTDDAKSRRQMNAYFDVDAAANAHGGRSLKAERSNKKPSKTEVKAFKEKRRARKEEKRRAWLRD